MGYRTVVISLYRPAWNDFRVETVHGSPEGRDALLGRERTWSDWEPLFDLRFESPRLLPAALGPVRLVLRHERLLRARHRDGRRPRRLASRGRALRPAAPQRGAHARDHVGRRADLGPASVRRRPRGPLRAGRPRRPGRPGHPRRGRGRPPPHRARAAAARLRAPDPDDVDRRDPPGGLRRHPRRAGLQQRLGRAHRPRRAARRAARGRGVDAGGGRGLAERRPRDAAAPARSASSRSRAASCCPATRRARGWASSAPPTSRRATAAARWPGTTTGSSSRCTTARASWSASSGPTSPRTGSSPRPIACRRCGCSPTRPPRPSRWRPPSRRCSSSPRTTRSRAWATAAPSRAAWPRRSTAPGATASASRSSSSTSTASRRSTTATATSRATWRWRRSATCCAPPCVARTAPSAWGATSSRSSSRTPASQEATEVVDRIGAGIAGVQAGAGHLLRASFGVAHRRRGARSRGAAAGRRRGHVRGQARRRRRALRPGLGRRRAGV